MSKPWSMTGLVAQWACMGGGILPRILLTVALGAMALVWTWGCASRQPPQSTARQTPPRAAPESAAGGPVRVQEGVASWYGPGFHGNPTSSGDTYDMFQMTAAHRTLPLGTKVLVTNLENRRTVEVVINDRGPFVKDRVIDLSYSAARVLGMIGPGTTRVSLEILEDPPGGPVADFSAKPYYALQMGAFSDKARALALQEELEKILGPGSVRITQVRVGTQDLFRVRVGRYAEREEVMAQARELAKKGYVVLVVSD
ncbi:MAG: septal ring lytic transglycosylase RlpA family protein [Thermodesulfobacteriota bacterium]